MARLLAAVALAALAWAASAQAPPASSGQGAPAGDNAKAIEKAKSMGRRGVEKVAPKLGRAEKLVRKAEPAVDRAVDLAVEKLGLAPRK